jgi:hypothetical protein
MGEQFRIDRAIQHNTGFFLSNTGSITDDRYCISRKNSVKLIELFSINKVSLV